MKDWILCFSKCWCHHSEITYWPVHQSWRPFKRLLSLHDASNSRLIVGEIETHTCWTRITSFLTFQLAYKKNASGLVSENKLDLFLCPSDHNEFVSNIDVRPS